MDSAPNLIQRRPFEKFLDKERGRRTDIGEFPFLFFMQSRAGLSGVLLSAGWFAVLGVYYRPYWSSITIAASVITLVGFFLIVFFADRWMHKITEREIESREDNEWDYFARVRMSLLVIGFALNCSLLISITGGLSSPFIPFYIMVYTLVLTKCAVPHPGTALFSLFACSFIIACAVGYFLMPSFTDPAMLAQIQQGGWKEIVDVSFAFLSMLVPYVSTRQAEARERKLAAARRRKANSNLRELSASAPN